MGRFAEAARALTGRQTSEQSLMEKFLRADVTADYFKENFARLELALEDEGWRRLAFNMKHEFSRGGLDKVIELSRAMYCVHPLIQRSVNVTTYYVHAQGWNLEAEEERIQKEVVEPTISDDGNRAELYGHQARILTLVDQMTDGNIFIKMPTGPRGEIDVRSIPVDEIREIYYKPGDIMTPWYYRRRWTESTFNEAKGQIEQKQREALYPDWRYHPRSQPSTIGGYDVMWEEPVLHRRTGGFKQMQFGIPSTYAALEWARAYKKFLEDWHSLVASLSRFAWNKTTKGKGKSKQAKEKLDSKVGEGGSLRDANKQEPAGAVHIDVEGADLTPIPKSGATTSAEDAKPSRLMVASAMDLPDTLLSNDPQQGALATAKTLDRPSELGFMNWQALERDLNQDIFRYQIDAMIRRGRLPGRVIREAGVSFVEPGIDPTVNVNFPPILEHDTKDVVQAIVAAATLEGKADAHLIPREETARLLMEAIGVDDVEQAMKELPEEEQEELNDAVDTLAEAVRMLKT